MCLLTEAGVTTMRKISPLYRSLRCALPACLVLATSALLLQPGSANAQLGEATSIARAMRPEYMTRDVQIFVEGLQLDPSQAMIVETLFDDYNDTFELGLEGMSAQIEGMREQILEMKDDQDRLLDLVLVPISQWLVKRDALGEELLGNVQVILMPYQLELYPKFEQRLYREKHLHEGRFSGESTDLIRIYRDMQLDRQYQEQSDLVVDQYGHKLHDVLTQRTKALYGSPKDIKRLMHPTARDAEQNLIEIDEISRLRVQVREVNDEYAQLISDALPAAEADAFFNKVMEKSYPRVFRSTPAERIFEDAVIREDLDPDVITSIVALMQQYGIELEASNIDLLEAIRRDEPKKPRATAEVAMMRRLGEPIPRQGLDDIRNAIRARDELSRQYISQLRGLLSEEQFAELPGARRWIPREERRVNPVRIPDKGAQNGNKASAANNFKSTGEEVDSRGRVNATGAPGNDVENKKKSKTQSEDSDSEKDSTNTESSEDNS